MEKQVTALKDKIKDAYANKEMQKMPYHLHSICVHDGNATTGHYYTFIYDRNQKKWRKFNDIRVTEVSEEDVIKESEGGHSW
jgi:ubiquitin carboxyl-terminal hydrolase 25/28